MEHKLISVTSELKRVKEGIKRGYESYNYTRRVFNTLSKDIDWLQHIGALDGLANEIESTINTYQQTFSTFQDTVTAARHGKLQV